MFFKEEKLKEIDHQIDLTLRKIEEYEAKYLSQIENVHPKYKKSARNLIHYLAYRSFNNNTLLNKINNLGFNIALSSESSVLYSLLLLKAMVSNLLHSNHSNNITPFLTNSESKQFIKHNSEALFGVKTNNRHTRIMVTQPSSAANDKSFIEDLLYHGMNCARINCAHDDTVVWGKIIDTIKSTSSNCKILMDLAGPKLRTGKMKPGHKVIHIKPKKNALGQVISPAKIWLAPYGILPPKNSDFDAVIPVNKKWLKKTRKGSYVTFTDSRNKKCKITIESKEGIGRWASCKKTAFVTTGTQLTVFLEKKSTSELHTVHEVLPLEEVIYLFEGDTLRIDKEPVLGEPTQYDANGKVSEIAHISCTLPQIFDKVKVGEPIYFDDGKIEGVIAEVQSNHLIIKITNAKKKGVKLRADKGINLPLSHLEINGLTEKDKTDLKFVAQHANAVNFSFVNNKTDVEDLLNELKKLNASIGIVLKIETQEAFKNLPSILIKAMENYPVGVMIARGDLAIETGWKNFALIQDEILKLCEAAHIPDIWATQVLENLAKKGIPTRAEITDAAVAQKAECVMLNKGPYILDAVKMLDKILSKIQNTKQKELYLDTKFEFNTNL